MPDLLAAGVRFNVVRLGAPPARLVLIHGLLLDNLASYYLSIAPALAEHASLLLYDLRGHGRSERPPTGYTMDDMVADVVAILDAEGLTAPITLIGNSFGAQIALRAAGDHPQRVGALVLIDPQTAIPDFVAELGDIVAADPAERDRRAYEYKGRWLAENAGTRDQSSTGAAPPTARATSIDSMLQQRRQRRSASVSVAEGLARDTSFVQDLKRQAAITDAQIERVHCPVLVVYGERSEMRRDEARLARLLPRADLATIPGMGHTVLMQAPDLLRDMILAWLARER
ncbi:MAG: alpha/beta hydrolase [Casimicrobiaceae bacterium]